MTSLDGIPGPAPDQLDAPPALPLSRVRLGAGGPLSGTRIADGRRVGDPADLVLVDVDPSEADARTPREMPVHATMRGGRRTHGPH